jgi:Tn3 transposase DDE domain
LAVPAARCPLGSLVPSASCWARCGNAAHLNAVVLWTTVYLNAALEQLKAQSYPVRKENTARLSPLVRKHLVHGTHSFALPDLEPSAIRELRDPDAPDEED